MPSQKARIRLKALDISEIDGVCQKIKNIAKETGVSIKGPIPLPTQHMKLGLRKSPCGNGSATYEHWEMRIHKRLVDIYADDRTMRAIMRIKIPDAVTVEIELLK
nr:30S ribosomal protein S10 [Candidatus Sigynarchaeum springense]